MIISHKYKFIFIKTRKTAGTSIEIALSKICGRNDIITPISNEDLRKLNSGRPAQNYDIDIYSLDPTYSNRRRGFFNHMSALGMKNNLPEKIWLNYFKFCFERHPYEKVVSHFYFLGGETRFNNIDSYLNSKEYKRLRSFDLYSINGKVKVDKIFKYEEMESSLSDIVNIVGLKQPIDISNIKAKSNYRPNRIPAFQVLEDHQKQKIMKDFEEEFKLFGYRV